MTSPEKRPRGRPRKPLIYSLEGLDDLSPEERLETLKMRIREALEASCKFRPKRRRLDGEA